MTVVVIAGSRALPPGQAPRLLVRFLAALPLTAKVLLRRGRTTSPGEFEQQTADLCKLMAVDYEWRQPEGSGRQATWLRDTAMIEEADLVLCFYRDDQIGHEESGTVALGDKAMAQDKAVYAYALQPSIESGWFVMRVGEHDPKNRWVEMVPAAPAGG